MNNDAVISECRLYRYRLDRHLYLPFGSSKVFAFFGINPSTADVHVDDATIRKMRGFTIVNGGHAFIVGNVFPYRATDVKELGLWYEDSGIREENDKHLIQIMDESDILIPCWGNSKKVPKDMREKFRHVMFLMACTGKPIMHLGLTKSGDPKHPLMLGYDTPIVPWKL